MYLNFKRFRFFPSIHNFKNFTFINLSLGLFSSFFNKGKYFFKNKIFYLLLINFLKKILIFSFFKKIIIFLKKIPKYLKDIINILVTPNISSYDNPFSLKKTQSTNTLNKILIVKILFIFNKSYSSLKIKKRGRVKRKIFKKINIINNITD